MRRLVERVQRDPAPCERERDSGVGRARGHRREQVAGPRRGAPREPRAPTPRRSPASSSPRHSSSARSWSLRATAFELHERPPTRRRQGHVVRDRRPARSGRPSPARPAARRARCAGSCARCPRGRRATGVRQPSTGRAHLDARRASRAEAAPGAAREASSGRAVALESQAPPSTRTDSMAATLRPPRRAVTHGSRCGHGARRRSPRPATRRPAMATPTTRPLDEATLGAFMERALGDAAGFMATDARRTGRPARTVPRAGRARAVHLRRARRSTPASIDATRWSGCAGCVLPAMWSADGDRLRAAARARAGARRRGRSVLPRRRLPADARLPAPAGPPHRGVPLRRRRAPVRLPRRDVGGDGSLRAADVRQRARAALGTRGRRPARTPGAGRALGRRRLRRRPRRDPPRPGVPGSSFVGYDSFEGQIELARRSGAGGRRRRPRPLRAARRRRTGSRALRRGLRLRRRPRRRGPGAAAGRDPRRAGPGRHAAAAGDAQRRRPGRERRAAGDAACTA